nr:hypothetical protein [Marinicella sp. W31]MDC2876411.1 hypothetical protein [Marinicella sp. W31]
MPIAAVLETALYADDLDAAEAFYGGVLGLEKSPASETGMCSFAQAPLCC